MPPFPKKSSSFANKFVPKKKAATDNEEKPEEIDVTQVVESQENATDARGQPDTSKGPVKKRPVLQDQPESNTHLESSEITTQPNVVFQSQILSQAPQTIKNILHPKKGATDSSRTKSQNNSIEQILDTNRSLRGKAQSVTEKSNSQTSETSVIDGDGNVGTNPKKVSILDESCIAMPSTNHGLDILSLVSEYATTKQATTKKTKRRSPEQGDSSPRRNSKKAKKTESERSVVQELMEKNLLNQNMNNTMIRRLENTLCNRSIIPHASEEEKSNLVTFTVFLRRSPLGLGLVLRDVCNRAVVKGFTENFFTLHSIRPNDILCPEDINSHSRSLDGGVGSASEVRVGDIIVSVNHVDVQSGHSFQQIIHALRGEFHCINAQKAGDQWSGHIENNANIVGHQIKSMQSYINDLNQSTLSGLPIGNANKFQPGSSPYDVSSEEKISVRLAAHDDLLCVKFARMIKDNGLLSRDASLPVQELPKKQQTYKDSNSASKKSNSSSSSQKKNVKTSTIAQTSLASSTEENSAMVVVSTESTSYPSSRNEVPEAAVSVENPPLSETLTTNSSQDTLNNIEASVSDKPPSEVSNASAAVQTVPNVTKPQVKSSLTAKFKPVVKKA